MSDIYTPPPRTAYYLAQAFYMPSDKGDRWAISFSGRSSVLVASALSVVVTLSFAALWKIICFVSLMFQGNESRRRFVGMIMLWNSGDAIAAFLRLVTYTVRCYPRTITKPKTGESETPSGASQNTSQEGKRPKQRGDFLYGLSLCLVCFAVWGGSVAMSTVVSWLVSIGHVAPVNPSVLFYPDIPGEVAVQQLKDFGLRAPGILRSLGSVEAAKVTLRTRVSIEGGDTGLIPNGNDLGHELNYDYNLTGVELGLRGGDGLSLGVKGFCRTEYDWYRPDMSTNASDVYHLWNNENQSRSIRLSEDAITRAPTAAFLLPNEYFTAAVGPPADSNYSFAIIVSSARRTSVTEGSDPWYTTELRDQPADLSHYNAKFWMKRARPILSCWEQMKWLHKGTALDSIADLRYQTDRTIPDVLVAVLEATFFGGPMLVRLGNASGDSALRSRTTSPNGVIDASMSSIDTDMERLVLASFVATRNIFNDATMFGGSEQNYPNVFRGGNGQPEEGSGHFVVSSPDIQTFSLTGIICLVSILVFLTAIWLLLEFLLLVLKGRHHPFWCKYHVLDAVQLFRCLYEKNDPDRTFTKTDRPTSEDLPKIRPYGGWRCNEGVPQQQIFREANGKDTIFNIEDDFCLLTPCKEKSCMGHILKDLAKEVNRNSVIEPKEPVRSDRTTPDPDTAMPQGDYEKRPAHDTINPSNLSNGHS
ncbi:hypothetical protein NEUTE1DRAFT_131032 [Neurospora tetrasperma FGSC 2508]|uniref:Uncharacterized protein n=1 Tax=Neurospora tetrasperma (strain FGSC 2508 / ATCC MYA-4615 / P0657) TaxID=510951 RepID=F8MT73_NEUT8|nr:uncharacterized protein NEUTE1DRAFT_131032 [Neurospora tetrasperma FGSC 2508]EGO55205.1 hypothetical protein NEUTE1DRAFT_131032 [Neurospora tetrasperma FGSC 2508]EGZ68701.1 hypothetical protein NEUTE2DRAFT_118917 [Neurospora tetrasperma FGSC 2509]